MCTHGTNNTEHLIMEPSVEQVMKIDETIIIHAKQMLFLEAVGEASMTGGSSFHVHLMKPLAYYP